MSTDIRPCWRFEKCLPHARDGGGGSPPLGKGNCGRFARMFGSRCFRSEQLVETFLIWQGEAVGLVTIFVHLNFRNFWKLLFSWWICSHFFLGTKMLFKHQTSLYMYIFIFLPSRLLRRCGNRTCPSQCGLSSWTRACCGTGRAGCGNSALWAAPGRWTAAVRRRRPPSAPASGRKAHDGLHPTRTACCWRGPRPS